MGFSCGKRRHCSDQTPQAEARATLYILSKPSFSSIYVPHGSVMNAREMPRSGLLVIGHVELHSVGLRLLAKRLEAHDLESNVIQHAPLGRHGRRVGFGERQVRARNVRGVKLARVSRLGAEHLDVPGLHLQHIRRARGIRDIEMHVVKRDGNGLCFVFQNLDPQQFVRRPHEALAGVLADFRIQSGRFPPGQRRCGIGHMKADVTNNGSDGRGRAVALFAPGSGRRGI